MDAAGDMPLDTEPEAVGPGGLADEVDAMDEFDTIEEVDEVDGDLQE